MQNCLQCNHIIDSEAKFCTQCGNFLRKPVINNTTKSLNLIIVFYLIFLLYSVLSHFIFETSDDSLGLDILIEGGFAILVLGFSLFDVRAILKLYKFPEFNWRIIGFSILFPIFSAFFVSISFEYINGILFEEMQINYFYEYIYLDNPLIWAIIFVAILPPIFEELAFRGFLFNQLQKVVNQKLTIIGTAFIFALIHFSFISLIWIFPFGLVLGYLRSKYNTLWYGIIIHFIHNFIVLMIDYYMYQQELFT